MTRVRILIYRENSDEVIADYEVEGDDPTHKMVEEIQESTPFKYDWQDTIPV